MLVYMVDSIVLFKPFELFHLVDARNEYVVVGLCAFILKAVR